MKFLVLCLFLFSLSALGMGMTLTPDSNKSDRYDITLLTARANMYVADTEKYIRDENLRKAKEDLKFAKSIIANKKTSLTIANLERAKRNLSFAQKEYKIAINTFNKRKSIFHKEMKRVIGIKPTNSQGWPGGPAKPTNSQGWPSGTGYGQPAKPNSQGWPSGTGYGQPAKPNSQGWPSAN